MQGIYNKSRLIYFSEFLKWDIYFSFSIFTVINQYFISLHSWMIFLTSGTLFDILRMLSLFLDSRKIFRSYYNQEKNLTISNLKLLFCVILFQLLSKIGIFIIVNSKHNSIFNSLREISFTNFLFTFHYVYGNGWENWIDKKIILLCFIRSFLKIFLLLSWDINLNPGSGHGFVIDIGYMYFHFLIVIFLKTVLTII